MMIEIFGPSSPTCQALADSVRRAADRLGVPYELYRVCDFNSIAARGILFTPALVIDGQVRSAGQILEESEIAKLLTAALCN